MGPAFQAANILSKDEIRVEEAHLHIPACPTPYALCVAHTESPHVSVEDGLSVHRTRQQI